MICLDSVSKFKWIVKNKLLMYKRDMYQIKSRIYLELDKTQKSAICNYLRVLVKQNLDKTCSEILDKFLYDEKYYLEQKSST